MPSAPSTLSWWWCAWHEYRQSRLKTQTDTVSVCTNKYCRPSTFFRAGKKGKKGKKGFGKVSKKENEKKRMRDERFELPTLWISLSRNYPYWNQIRWPTASVPLHFTVDLLETLLGALALSRSHQVQIIIIMFLLCKKKGVEGKPEILVHCQRWCGTGQGKLQPTKQASSEIRIKAQAKSSRREWVQQEPVAKRNLNPRRNPRVKMTFNKTVTTRTSMLDKLVELTTRLVSKRAREK